MVGSSDLALTDLQIRQLKAGDKTIKRSVWEDNSLFIVVEPKRKAKNTKSFVGTMRFPPTRSGKQISVRIGVYGNTGKKISLKAAREEWDRLRKWSKKTGRDPRELQKEEKKVQVIRENNPTLMDAVNGWFSRAEHRPTTRRDYENKINNQIVPVLGADTPIKMFDWSNGGREKVLQLKEEIEKRGASIQADRVLMILRQIFDFSIDRGWMDEPNPAKRTTYRISNRKVKHNPYLDWDELPEFFDDLNENKANGSFIVISAIKLTVLTFQRVGSLVPMKFSEIDEKENMWVIPAERMKAKEEHYVPLTSQMRNVIEKMAAINGDQGYVFWSSRGKGKPYVSENSLNNHLKNMGYRGRQSTHGFRSVALTCGVEELGFDKEIIRRQMAHAIGDKTERSYLHAKFFKQRRKFMNAWSKALVERGLVI